MFFSDCNVAVELVKYVTIVYNLIYYVWYSFAAAAQAHIRFVQFQAPSFSSHFVPGSQLC